MARPRLLVIGDAAAPTGFGRVTREILSNLPEGSYDIHQLGVNYHGDPHGERWPIYPAHTGGDLQGVGRIKELVDKLQPSLVFAVNDLWVLRDYLVPLREYVPRVKVVVYAPVDAGPVDPEWLRDFQHVSRVVLYTQFGRQELLKALPEEYHDRVDVIPHGINTAEFFPIAHEKRGEASLWDSTCEAKARLGLFRDEEIASSFVVLNANRNQPRKRIDITIRAFAIFARDKPPNVQLYLHMGTEDMGWNVLKLARRYGVYDRLILTANKNAIPGVSVEQLNLIYNACDVGVNTATGEGWGLPNFEHAATGKAQVVPRFGALAEIWEGCAEFVDPVYDFVYERTLTLGHLVAPEAVAKALERLYAEPEHRRNVAQACYLRATHPDFQWPNIARRWHALFQEVLEGGLSSGGESSAALGSGAPSDDGTLEALAKAAPGPVVATGFGALVNADTADGLAAAAESALRAGRTFRFLHGDAAVVEAIRKVFHRYALAPELAALSPTRSALRTQGPIGMLWLCCRDTPEEVLEQYTLAGMLPGGLVVVEEDAEATSGGNPRRSREIAARLDEEGVPATARGIVSWGSKKRCAFVARLPVGRGLGLREERSACYARRGAL